MKKLLNFLLAGNVASSLPLGMTAFTSSGSTTKIINKGNQYFNNIVNNKIVINNIDLQNQSTPLAFTKALKKGLLRANPVLDATQESFFNFANVDSTWVQQLKANPLNKALVLTDQSKKMTFTVSLENNVWTPKKMFVLGDSLSDDGNFAAIVKSKFNTKLSPQMFQSQRFCDGLVTVENLSNYFGLPALQHTFNNPFGNDYAVAGAPLIPYTKNPVPLAPSFLTSWLNNYTSEKQVTRFLAQHAKDQNKQNDLVVFEFGANDFILNMLPYDIFKDASTTNLFINQMLNQEKTQLTRLINAGFTKIIDSNLGNISILPSDTAGLPKQEITNILKAVNKYDNLLKPVIKNLNTKYGSQTIMPYDIYHNFKHIAQGYHGYYRKMGAYHYSFSILKNQVLTLPNKYTTSANAHDFLYFDGTHPSNYVDKMLANVAYNQANAFFTKKYF